MHRATAVACVLIACGVVFTAAHCSAATPQNWITLDKVGDEDVYLWREARMDSLERRGPWALFEQRFRGVKAAIVEKGPGQIERIARNCLTGARGTVYHWRNNEAGHIEEVHATLDEIEQGLQDPAPLSRQEHSQAAEVQFACDCRQKIAAQAPTRAELEGLYAQHYEQQRTMRAYHLGYIRVDELSTARRIVKALDTGQPFADLADQHSNSRQEFPHGDLGTHPESDWTVAYRRIFRSLKKGEYTREPIDGIYGYELFQLIDVIVQPAPGFDTALPALEAYGIRAKQCGWPM